MKHFIQAKKKSTGKTACSNNVFKHTHRNILFYFIIFLLVGWLFCMSVCNNGDWFYFFSGMLVVAITNIQFKKNWIKIRMMFCGTQKNVRKMDLSNVTQVKEMENPIKNCQIDNNLVIIIFSEFQKEQKISSLLFSRSKWNHSHSSNN